MFTEHYATRADPSDPLYRKQRQTSEIKAETHSHAQQKITLFEL